jgi:hypothetical protein
MGKQSEYRHDGHDVAQKWAERMRGMWQYTKQTHAIFWGTISSQNHIKPLIGL